IKRTTRIDNHADNLSAGYLIDVYRTHSTFWNVIRTQPRLGDRVLNGGLVGVIGRTIAATARLFGLFDSSRLRFGLFLGFCEVFQLRKLMFFKLALLVGVLAAFFGLIQLLENVFQLFALFSGFELGHFLLLLFFFLRTFGLFRLLLGLLHHFLLVL